MNNNETMALCLSLMKSDSEEAVMSLLREAGFWEEEKYWRFYGDNENNYSTIGNQQSRSDAAMVEKLINCVDARLINECWVSGVDPESDLSPRTIQQAVARFYDATAVNTSNAGKISDWTSGKRTDVSRGITLAATGMSPKEGNPCFTIVDQGEGQTPERMPDTLLSLNKSNKLRIPFVQGKFNMGSTGALIFCGKRNLQLIVSRRNPFILHKANATDAQWSFTVIRREDPSNKRRSSVYTYLAPMGADRNPGSGGLLRFDINEMPLFPSGRDAYARNTTCGTLIKLYEYQANGYSNTHILRKDGLLGRLDLLLPEVALPIRLHECRPSFRGHEGSFETTLSGLRVRLEDDKGKNLEPDFPSSSPMSASGETMTATIYAFKKDRAETYRKNEGVIFVLNGQTHGHLTKDFFTRKNAGRLNYIADSILVIVDCSKFSGRAREDLFMNSRDRLRNCALRSEIEEQIEDLLREHSGLRALREKRRREEVESKLDDSKPLEEILESLLKLSPTLSNLFLPGLKLSNPFKTAEARSKVEAFTGQRYPSYFKFKGKEYGLEITKDYPHNKRAKIVFETDVVNDYFDREIDQGEFALFMVINGEQMLVASYTGPNLHNGLAQLTVKLPNNCSVGDQIKYIATVKDPIRTEPFSNTFTIKVMQPVEDSDSRDNIRRDNPPRKKDGVTQSQAGISLPNVIEVHEPEWKEKNFDQYTALTVSITDALDQTSGKKVDVFDFYVNMDNVYLKTELKATGEEIEVTRARWKYGLVLLGLSLLHQDAQSKNGSTTTLEEKDTSNEDKMSAVNSIEKQIEHFTRGIGQVLLPIINSLGGLDLDTAVSLKGAGEAT